MDRPRESTLLNYQDDCKAEARRETPNLPRESEGVYTLPITQKEANSIFEAVQEIREQVKKGVLKYTYINQTSDNDKPDKNYNCSGIVEKIISENLGIKFGDVNSSCPQRVSTVMLETPNIRVDKHDEKALAVPLPSQFNHQSDRSVNEAPQSRL